MSGGVWFYASYQQSSDKINQREVVATVIKAGTYYGESEELRLKSTQIEAYNAYFVTDKLTIETESHTSHRESSSFGASIQIPVSGGTSPSFGANIAELEADESVPFTASIFIHNKLSIDVNGEASIKGASISAKSLAVYFQSLMLESVQEIGSSDGFNFGISSGLKKESLLSGMSAEISYSNRNVVKQMTQLIGSESTKVVVMHALHLNGAVIANAEIGEDGKYTDLGNLELTAGELFIKHIYDADEGLTLGGGFSLGKKITKDENNPYSNKYTATFGGKDGEGYTRATIGKGKVVIGGEDVSKCKLGEDNDKCKDVNRDINSAQDFDYTYNIDTIKMVFIDPKEVIEKTKKVAENIKAVFGDKDTETKGGSKASDSNTAANSKPQSQPPDYKDEKPKPIPVEAGKTLSHYANKYGTTVEALAELNNIEDPNLIYTEQKLEVPTDAKYPAGNNPNYVEPGRKVEPRMVWDALSQEENTEKVNQGTCTSDTCNTETILQRASYTKTESADSTLQDNEVSSYEEFKKQIIDKGHLKSYELKKKYGEGDSIGMGGDVNYDINEDIVVESYLKEKYKIFLKTGKRNLGSMSLEIYNIGELLIKFKAKYPSVVKGIKYTADLPGQGLEMFLDIVLYPFKPLKPGWDAYSDFVNEYLVPDFVKAKVNEAGLNYEDWKKGLTEQEKAVLDDTTYTGKKVLDVWALKTLIQKAGELAITDSVAKKVFSKADDAPSKKVNDLDNKLDTKKSNAEVDPINKNSDALNNKQGKINPVVNEPINNVPENVVSKEAHLVDLRASMSKPHVENQELKKIVDNLYKPNAKVGSGSTAAALREELVTGKPVGGKMHKIKTIESINRLDDWIRNNPRALSGDRAAAENILKDLHNALNGGKDGK